MFGYKIIRDQAGNIDQINVSLSGNDLLNSSKLNKGCAFSEEERERFNLIGLLPPLVESLDQQVARMYMQFKEHGSNLSKHIYLNVLHDYNETLFYSLASQHLEEMLPILYTPTVGEAVQHFSLEHRKTKGLYLSYENRHRMSDILGHYAGNQIDLSVITDGEAVLGIGDQGVGGINISIAKAMVYTLGGGIHPSRLLPIQLDVGTNNPHLLNDPMYLGSRHERITGQAYYDFIDQFVKTITKCFPTIYLHWEDFGRDHASEILSRYRNEICTINGDMQSTGVVALACVLAAANASGLPLKDHRIVIFGAGTAGVGIADQIASALVRSGLSQQAALKRLWLIDKGGLLTSQSSLLPFQAPYARSFTEVEAWSLQNASEISLLDVVHQVKPTILIGCSTVSGAFNETVVKAMATHVPRPIIMPLSNPTILSEANPADLLQWTDGKAIIATGSPFHSVSWNNKHYHIAQSNNAFVFPGLGLGVLAVKANRVTDDMLWAATNALSACSPMARDPFAALLPKLSNAKFVSYQIALAVAEQACREGVATAVPVKSLSDTIKGLFWEPQYYPYRKV